MEKSQIKRIVLTHLLDKEIISPSEVMDEITWLLQLKRLEIEERDKKREAQYRMKELELRAVHVELKELEAKVDRSIRRATEAGTMVPFDVNKHIKFVPDFRENEVDKYFLHFEKVAKILKCLKITGHYCCRAP